MKSTKNLDKKVYSFLSKNYPRVTDGLLVEDNGGEELSDEEYNYYFFELVDALREEFDEMNDDKGGCGAIANDYVEYYMSKIN